MLQQFAALVQRGAASTAAAQQHRQQFGIRQAVHAHRQKFVLRPLAGRPVPYAHNRLLALDGLQCRAEHGRDAISKCCADHGKRVCTDTIMK